MKKTVFFLIAARNCMQVQPVDAARYILAESVAEYNTIIQTIGNRDPQFANLFSPYDAITKLDRITPEINKFGEVEYYLQTCRTVIDGDELVCGKVMRFIVTILVEAVPGDPIITVLSIVEEPSSAPERRRPKEKKRGHHHHCGIIK